MSILTGECKVKKILDANSDVLGDLTGVKASSSTPFSFFSEGSKLADYSISGASGGVGENRNLFDKNNADLVSLYPDQNTGAVTDGSEANAYSIVIPINEGSYIFQLNSPSDVPISNRLRCACYSTYPYAGTVALSVDETSARSGDLLYNAFYAPEGTAYVMVFLWSGSSYTSEVINSAIMNNNLMLERGTGLNLSEYAAYGECYDIPIAVKGKNEIINTIATQTYNGLTLTRNTDGSLTVNGTASANTNFVLKQDSHTFVPADHQEIEKEKYILSGSPADGAVNKYLMSFRYTSAVGTTSSIVRVPAGGSIKIDNTNGEYNIIAPYITIWEGATCENVTFYPMLRKENTIDDYEAPFNSTVRLSLNAPLGAGDTITLEDTNIDVPICNGVNTITFQTSVQPSEVTIYTNKSGTKKTGKIMDASNHTLVNLFPFTNMYKVSYYSQDGNTLISREYVPHGGNAVGSIVTSKESSAQYNYVFVGWNTLINQTTATENVLQNITSDKNVYAAFSETARTYTTYFYNGETLLETVTGVPYGGTATYTGATPTSSQADYIFSGWSPLNTNITADTSCYAQFEEDEMYESITDTWSEIIANIGNGTYSTRYQVGDTKKIDLGTEGEVIMTIVGIDADDLADESGKAPITWISKQLLKTKHRMNPAYSAGTSGTGTLGGWEACEMRSYLINTIKPLLPSEVHNALKTVKKYSKIYNTSETAVNNVVSNDDIWIPSAYEVNFTGYETSGVTYSTAFRKSASKIKHKVGGTAEWWWLRSADATKNFSRVTGGGGSSYGYANLSASVAVGFVI